MDILSKIIRDERKLLKSGERFLTPPCQRLPRDYLKGSCRVAGYVPMNSRAAYSLFVIYQGKLAKAESVADQVKFAALAAGAKKKWEIDREDFCAKLKKPEGAIIEILRDWSIAVITRVTKAGRVNRLD